MFLERAIEVFEEIFIAREIVEQDEYKELVEKSRNSFLAVGHEVEKVQDPELRNRLKELIGEFADNAGDRCAYEVHYTYEKSIKLGYALSAFKGILE